MFTLKIETYNAVFTEDPGTEISRIIEAALKDIRQLTPVYNDRGALRDISGNTVGTWNYTKEN